MASDIPTHSIDTKSRLGDLHVASVMDKEVAKEHGRLWEPEMKEKVDTQTRMVPGASLMVDGGGRCCLRGLRRSAIVFWVRN